MQVLYGFVRIVTFNTAYKEVSPAVYGFTQYSPSVHQWGLRFILFLILVFECLTGQPFLSLFLAFLLESLEQLCSV